VCLLKRHTCRIKRGFKIAKSEVLGAFDKLSHSSTVLLRGIECGTDVLIMFEFELKKMSQRATTCGLWRASGGTRSVRKVPLNCVAK